MGDTTRHFEFEDGKSSKCWEITQAGESVTLRYGKTGTTRQNQTKVFVEVTVASARQQ